MSALNPSGKSSITILVLGDAGVGKTSLISSLVSESWSDRLPPVLQPVMVPPTLMPEHIQLTIIDSSSDPAHTPEWLLHLRPPPPLGAPNAAPLSSKASLLADAVLLVVAADVADSFARVESFWLPLLEDHAARTRSTRRPVLIAVNKSAQDGSDDSSSSSAAALSMPLDGSYLDSSVPSFEHLVHSHRVSCVLPCSAKFLWNLSRLFHVCNTVILAPVEPLFDLHSVAHPSAPGCMRFKLLTQKALLRIFRLFDADGDGVLSFPELDRMHQVNFKGKRLAPRAFDQLMQRLAATNRDFVRPVAAASAGNAAAGGSSGIAFTPSSGLSFSGLLHFHALFLEKNHHLWHTWSLVQQFGYELGAVNTAATTAGSAANSVVGGAPATAAAAMPSASAPMQRGSSQSAVVSSNSASASSAAAALAASAASSPAALPSLGSLVLSESYAKLHDPFSAAIAYELSPIAVEFLTSLFHKFDSDHDGLLSIRPSYAAAAQSASASAVAAAAAFSGADAWPSATCSLSGSSDLERMFLACPDVAFGASFAKFVSRAAMGPGKDSSSHIGLDGWLAAWALLLFHCSTPAAAAGSAAFSSTAAAPSLASSSFVAQVQAGPDVVLRYLAYLGFPVSPALPEFSDEVAPAGHTQRRFLPRIQRCIHVTPRPRQPGARGGGGGAAIDATELAQSVNERIFSSDPGASMSSIRAALQEPSALRPRTVSVFVLGSVGCGKTSFIDCMLGNAPPVGSNLLTQHVSSSTVAGLSAVLPKEDVALSDAAGASVGTSSQPRTYAARLPLAHLPAAASSAAGASDASSAINPALRTASNRFMLLTDIPASSASALLSPSSASAGATVCCDLVLLLYDGTSVSSRDFALARLQQCFERKLPVLVVQTKADYANASLPRNDFNQLDFEVSLESFSALAFWRAMGDARSSAAAVSVPAALPSVATIFERVYHAARHPAPHVLTSLSAARRAQQQSKFILSSLAVAAGAVGLWALFRSGALPTWPPAMTASAAATNGKGVANAQTAAPGAQQRRTSPSSSS